MNRKIRIYNMSMKYCVNNSIVFNALIRAGHNIERKHSAPLTKEQVEFLDGHFGGNYIQKLNKA